MKILTTPNLYNIRKAGFLKAGQQVPQNTALTAANEPVPVVVADALQAPVVNIDKING